MPNLPPGILSPDQMNDETLKKFLQTYQQQQKPMDFINRSKLTSVGAHEVLGDLDRVFKGANRLRQLDFVNTMGGYLSKVMNLMMPGSGEMVQLVIKMTDMMLAIQDAHIKMRQSAVETGAAFSMTLQEIDRWSVMSFGRFGQLKREFNMSKDTYDSYMKSWSNLAIDIRKMDTALVTTATGQVRTLTDSMVIFSQRYQADISDVSNAWLGTMQKVGSGERNEDFAKTAADVQDAWFSVAQAMREAGGSIPRMMNGMTNIINESAPAFQDTAVRIKSLGNFYVDLYNYLETMGKQGNIDEFASTMSKGLTNMSVQTMTLMGRHSMITGISGSKNPVGAGFDFMEMVRTGKDAMGNVILMEEQLKRQAEAIGTMAGGKDRKMLTIQEGGLNNQTAAQYLVQDQLMQMMQWGSSIQDRAVIAKLLRELQDNKKLSAEGMKTFLDLTKEGKEAGGIEGRKLNALEQISNSVLDIYNHLYGIETPVEVSQALAAGRAHAGETQEEAFFRIDQDKNLSPEEKEEAKKKWVEQEKRDTESYTKEGERANAAEIKKRVDDRIRQAAAYVLKNRTDEMPAGKKDRGKAIKGDGSKGKSDLSPLFYPGFSADEINDARMALIEEAKQIRDKKKPDEINEEDLNINFLEQNEQLVKGNVQELLDSGRIERRTQERVKKESDSAMYNQLVGPMTKEREDAIKIEEQNKVESRRNLRNAVRWYDKTIDKIPWGLGLLGALKASRKLHKELSPPEWNADETEGILGSTPSTMPIPEIEKPPIHAETGGEVTDGAPSPWEDMKQMQHFIRGWSNKDQDFYSDTYKQKLYAMAQDYYNKSGGDTLNMTYNEIGRAHV